MTVSNSTWSYYFKWKCFLFQFFFIICSRKYLIMLPILHYICTLKFNDTMCWVYNGCLFKSKYKLNLTSVFVPFYRNSWMKCFGSCLPCLRRPSDICQNVKVRLLGPLPTISLWSLLKVPWKTTCFCIRGCFNSTQRVGHSSPSS